MKKTYVAIGAIALILIAVQFFGMQSATGNVAGKSVATEEKVVTKVIDGDTIVVEGGEIIRLLDIDTPERGEACYKEAKDRLARLVDGRPVSLEAGKEDKDRYGRLLRYVFHNNTNVNVLLVREGLANLYFYDKNTPYYRQLVDAEQSAKEEGLCVWK